MIPLLRMLFFLRAATAFPVHGRRFLHRTTTKLRMQISTDTIVNQLEIPIDTAIQLHDKVKFIDGTWWMPNDTTHPNAVQAFEQGPRIAGAKFCDIDDLADKTTDLPHMMPPTALWAAYMTQYCGISSSSQDHIIVYGQSSDCMFTHRAFVQALSMGHAAERLHILQGSLQDWIQAGGPIDTEPVRVVKAKDLDMTVDELLSSSTLYPATPDRAVVDMAEVRRICESSTSSSSDDTTNKYQIVDVRSPDRFYGRVEEPRPGLRLGHMPGATNVFFLNLLQEDAPVRLKPVEELKSILGELVDTEKVIVASCGSGATACTLKVALMACGRDPDTVQIYDGSWTEWGAQPDTPIVKKD